MTPARPPAAPTTAAAVCMAAPAVDDELAAAVGRALDGLALCPPVVVDFVAATMALDSSSSSSDADEVGLADLVVVELVALALALETLALDSPMLDAAPRPPVDWLRICTTVAVGAHTRWLTVVCEATLYISAQLGALDSVQARRYSSLEHEASERQEFTAEEATQRVAILQESRTVPVQQPNQLSAVL